jgi:hypothetical protein
MSVDVSMTNEKKKLCTSLTMDLLLVRELDYLTVMQSPSKASMMSEAWSEVIMTLEDRS